MESLPVIVTLDAAIAVLDRIGRGGGLQCPVRELLVVPVVAIPHGAAICHGGVADTESPNIHVFSLSFCGLRSSGCSAGDDAVGVFSFFFRSFFARVGGGRFTLSLHSRGVQ